MINCLYFENKSKLIMLNQRIWEKYSFVGIIGNSEYGVVYKGKNKTTGKNYTIKEINILKRKLFWRNENNKIFKQ